MFMSKKKENLSVLDKEVSVEGSLSFKGRLVIRGTLKGSLSGEHIVIGEGGAVFADTEATSMTVGGVFDGRLKVSEELAVLSTGNCRGTVVCKDLIIEPGGILNADVSCLRLQEESPKAEAEKKEAPPEDA